jgi:radical SAM superfamily enzyme YgiQ (UPF0313 family)
VGHPGQYVGLEVNRLWQEPKEGDLTVVMAFPDTYAIGISHLGSQILYHILNSMGGVSCDRAYCPDLDAQAAMRSGGIELFGWESRCAIRDFDILGFSLPYELCVTNVLSMLDLAHVPLHADGRGAGDPIVIAGDALADTPEPMADFIDMFIVGDGETPLRALAQLARSMKAAGATRDDIILQAARTIPSIYAPRFYRSTGILPVSRTGVPPVASSSVSSVSSSSSSSAAAAASAAADADVDAVPSSPSQMQGQGAAPSQAGLESETTDPSNHGRDARATHGQDGHATNGPAVRTPATNSPAARMPATDGHATNSGAAHDYQSIHRDRPDMPEIIHRAHLSSMSESPLLLAPLVPLSEGVHERVIIEVMRGCPNACRFCQAGATRLPVRFREVDEIVQAAKTAIQATGYHEISLLSLSTSDLPHLGELIDQLTEYFTPRHVSISLPSLRVDSQLRVLPKLTSQVRKGGLTIAAEAGSQRLRSAIRKNITEEDMVEGVKAAYAAGWNKVKVYFMAGLPGETDADIVAMYDLCRRLSDARREVDGQRGNIGAAVSWFVPKPHTPMQWCAMRDIDYFFGVRRRLMELSRRTPVSFKFHRIERSLLEAMLCRGDRRAGKLIEAVWRNGAAMDSWDEHFDYAKWQAAMDETGLGLDKFAIREFSTATPLPWSHIQCYRSEEFLLGEHQRMNEALKTE